MMQVGLRSDIDQWCKENLAGPVVVRYTGWFSLYNLVFESESDAIMFKMRWTE